MNNPQKIEILLGNPCLESYADPPEDPLGELSHFEMGLRRFCYESDRPVLIKIGNEQIQVFFDPDICMLFEDRFPEQIFQLSQGKEIELFFPESSRTVINLIPAGNKINCILNKFGTRSDRYECELETEQVLKTLKSFLEEVMQLAVEEGYITPEEKQEFLMPTTQAKLELSLGR